MSNSLWHHGLQHTRLPCPSPIPRAYSNLCPLSRWCHLTISASDIPFSSCLQSFPGSGSFPRSQFFVSGGQSIGASALPSVLLMNIYDWFPLGLIGLITLQSKGLSRVFSNITVQKHQFFGVQLSLWSNSHIHTWCEVKWSESHSVVSDSLWPHGLYSPWNSPGQNTGMGSLSLLQGIFLTQGLNPDLLHCKWILYQLNHKESPRILEWVAYPFSSRSSWPRDKTRVSCIAGGFFTN